MEYIFNGVDLEGKRVLDIGGGNGLHSFYSASSGAKSVTCLEPMEDGSSTGILDIFEKLKAISPRGSIVELDTNTIQEYQNKDIELFDVVLLINSINHLDEKNCIRLKEDRTAREEYKKIVEKIYFLTGSEAKIIITDCSNRNFFGMLRMKNPFAPNIDWEVHQSPETWANLMEEGGFHVTSLEWSTPNRLGNIGKILFGNRFASFFMQSHFRLVMEK